MKTRTQTSLAAAELRPEAMGRGADISFFERLAAIAGICMALTAASMTASARDALRLTIVVDGDRNSRGVIGALLFRSGRGWPEHVDAAFRAKAAPAHAGTVTLTLEGLPPGDYAAVVLHDENENKKLDRGLFGVPQEGWGMSNNPKARAAAPGFDRARFILRRNTRLRIRLNY